MERVKGALILCYGHVAALAPRELVLPKVESDILRNMFQYFNTKVGRVAVGRGWLPSHVVTRLTFCRSGSGNKGRDQGTVCRS